jgi:hypothetical protein
MRSYMIRFVLAGGLLTLVSWTAALQSACSGGDTPVEADPAFVSAFDTVQLDEFQINTNAPVTKRVYDEFKADEPEREDFEVWLVDDATDQGLYCSGRLEGLASARAVNLKHANLGATFIPTEYTTTLIASDAEAKIDRVRIEIWERDAGTCPVVPWTKQYSERGYKQKNDLVSTKVLPAKTLLAQQDVMLNNDKIRLAVSVREASLAANVAAEESASTSATTDENDTTSTPTPGLWLDTIYFSSALDDPGAPEIELGIFNPAASQLIACVGKGALDAVDKPTTTYTAKKVLRFATGVTAIPPLVRVAIIDLDKTEGCPDGISIPAGDDVVAISHIMPKAQLVGETTFNDGISKVTLTDVVPEGAAASDTSTSTSASSGAAPIPTPPTPKIPLDLAILTTLRIDTVRFASKEADETKNLLQATGGSEIEVFLFSGVDDSVIACSGQDHGMEKVDSFDTLYGGLNATLVKVWPHTVSPEDQVYWGLVERDEGNCPTGPFTKSGDLVFATSAKKPLSELINAAIDLSVSGATLTVVTSTE